jgi:hypothetical protein
MSKDIAAVAGKRLLLSSEAYALLVAEVNKLKQKGAHFKLNEAKLASVVIEIFCTKYLDKERKQIEAKFFNKKSYLKMLIEKSESEEDLSSSLDEFLHKSKKAKLAKHTEDVPVGVDS